MESVAFPRQDRLSVPEMDEEALRMPLVGNRGGFEQALADFLHVQHVTGMEVGGLAGFLAVEALDLGPKDHIVLSPFTPAPIVKALAVAGVKATLVDSEPVSPRMDITKLPKAIGRRTRALFAPHVAGFVEPMDELLDLALDRGIVLVEIPNGHFGGQFRDYRIGSLGHATIVDFASIPAFAGLKGGALATNIDTLAVRARQGLRHLGSAFMSDAQASLAGMRLAHFASIQEGLLDVGRAYQNAFRKVIHGRPPGDIGGDGYCLRVDTDVVGDVKPPASRFAVSALQQPVQTFGDFQRAFGWKADCARNSERWFRRALPMPFDPNMTTADALALAEGVRERLSG